MGYHMKAFDGQHSAMVRVQSWDCDTDIFTLAAVGFCPEDEEEFPVYSRAAPDFDDFQVPGVILPALIGEYGAPEELVGEVFVVKQP